jgi:hypothetical protein
VIVTSLFITRRFAELRKEVIKNEIFDANLPLESKPRRKLK